MNPQALVDLLSQYDPTTDQYLGNWAAVARRHKLDRLPVSYIVVIDLLITFHPILNPLIIANTKFRANTNSC